MKNILFGIEELSKKPVFCIFTVIQLTISFILIFIGISASNSINIKAKAIDNLFMKKEYYVIDDNNSKIIEEIELKDLIEFKNYIVDNNISFYLVNNDSTNIYLPNLNDDMVENFDACSLNNMDFKTVKLMYISDSYIKDIKIELSEGSYKGKSKEAIPIILGSNYKGLININDLIPFCYINSNGEKEVKYYEVCGFANKGSFVCIKGDPQNIISVDNYIMLVTDSQDEVNGSNEEMVKKINIFNSFIYGYFDFKDEDERESVEKFSKRLGLNYCFKSISDVEQDFIKDYESQLTKVKMFAISILIFTVISIAMVMLNMIENMKKEFSINMLVGASFSDIALRVFYQVAILFIASITCSLFILDIFICDENMIKLNFINSIEFIMISIIICVFVSIIPILKFKRISINSLIKGSE